MSVTRLQYHPFKEGVLGILRGLFSDLVVNNFRLNFEAQTIKKADSVHIWRQLRDDVLVLEVLYHNTDDDTYEFICDVWSNWTKRRTEAHLMRMITDKFKAGKIGRDWVEKKGKIHISQNILSGKYETKSN